jgi:ribosome-associated heat shock protein Hsp15
MHASDAQDKVRMDKWLWAARFFKTRSLAADAVTGGKVQLNGERAKPAKTLKVGDELRIRTQANEFTVRVRVLSERRGSAAVAATLFEETPESRAARERVAEQKRFAANVTYDWGRPTKRDRRMLDRVLEDVESNEEREEADEVDALDALLAEDDGDEDDGDEDDEPGAKRR